MHIGSLQSDSEVKFMYYSKPLGSLLAIALLCTGCASLKPAWWQYQFRDKAPQRDVQTVAQRLVATGLPIQHVGTAHYDGADWTIDALKVRRSDARQQVCVFGGIHGNEPAGTESALALAEALAKQPTLYPQTNFVIVPLSNPWGWAHNLRHNGKNQDIARNFNTDGTQETRVIKGLLAQERCGLVVDLHEDDRRSGFYMLTYANPDPQFTPRILQETAQAVGVAVSAQVPDGVYQIPQQDFAKNSHPTLSQYARQQGANQSYVIETSTRLPMDKRVEIDRQLLDKLIRAFR
jgi:uncharacterized lipoprotein YmbA